MEFLEGQSLAEFVKGRGLLPADVAFAVLHQVGHASLGRARGGVVHCDLKPENIFIAASQTVGVPFDVKVLDFGIARVVKDGRSSVTVTTAIGSPHWLAPEQGTKGRTVSPATDVWSFGLIAFWMLSGRYYWKRANVPDADLNLYALLGEIAGETPSCPRASVSAPWARPGAVAAWLRRVVRLCVARDVNERFANGGRRSTRLRRR
ncbi:MAG: serine/threonine protein kinase [Deltaproteobacteria bacterium]|nr:serine/threonine protein kinase [Deltaproteobacteria bacterium]